MRTPGVRQRGERTPKCTGLFLSLVALSFLHTFSEAVNRIFPFIPSLVGVLLYTGVLLSSVRVLSETGRQVVRACLLAAPALVLIWLDSLVGSVPIKITYLFFSLVFIGFTVGRLLSYVLKTGVKGTSLHA